MSAPEAPKSKMKWPICTLIIVLIVGGVFYWGYTKFQQEQTIIAQRAASAPQTSQVPRAPANITAGPIGQGAHAYRSAMPLYFISGFAVLMALIFGVILYLWWSLKDLEGGKNIKEEDSP